MSTRKVIANIALSLDGRYGGRGAPTDMSWVVPYAVGDVGRDHLTSLWEHATTAVLGRVNAEGFLGFWPTIIGVEGVDPRDEGYAKWLASTEKVVFSSTLAEAPWPGTTIENRPAPEVVGELKEAGGGDILVSSSVSVIRALLEADLVDTLALLQVPVVLGGGPSFFGGTALPAGEWRLASHRVGDGGEIAVRYDRAR